MVPASQRLRPVAFRPIDRVSYNAMTPTRIRTPSPATIALAGAGATQTQVADLLGVTQVAVSQWFAGVRSAPPELNAAIENLLGADSAATVISSIPSREPAAA